MRLKSQTTGVQIDKDYSPMVGIVVTISPNLSLYKIVVLPAASNPTINILISFLPKRPLNKFANTLPIFYWILLDSAGWFSEEEEVEMEVSSHFDFDDKIVFFGSAMNAVIGESADRKFVSHAGNFTNRDQSRIFFRLEIHHVIS